MKEQVAEAYKTSKRFMKRLFYMFIFLTVVFVVGYIFIRYYPYIFARNVNGVIANVEKPNAPMTFVGAGTASDKGSKSFAERLVFSYAVSIQLKDGEIVAASSEDRQWAVAEKGKCVEAKFFPYPPWRFDRYGTYFGARLLKMYDCASPMAKPSN